MQVYTRVPVTHAIITIPGEFELDASPVQLRAISVPRLAQKLLVPS